MININSTLNMINKFCTHNDILHTIKVLARKGNTSIVVMPCGIEALMLIDCIKKYKKNRIKTFLKIRNKEITIKFRETR